MRLFVLIYKIVSGKENDAESVKAILYRQIMYAKELLHTGVSPQDAAFKCGFSEYSNFFRSFNKIVGVSPREYVNRIQMP